MAEFTVDHQAWFQLWLPLGASVPTDDTYRLLVRQLEPETALQAALLLRDGTCLPGLRELASWSWPRNHAKPSAMKSPPSPACSRA